MSRTRLEPDVRKKLILLAAVVIAERDGYTRMRRADIAHEAGVATGLVSRYFGTMTQLKRTVMRHAVTEGTLPVIAQGIANRDPHALKAPEEMRKAAVQSMLG